MMASTLGLFETRGNRKVAGSSIETDQLERTPQRNAAKPRPRPCPKSRKGLEEAKLTQKLAKEGSSGSAVEDEKGEGSTHVRRLFPATPSPPNSSSAESLFALVKVKEEDDSGEDGEGASDESDPESKTEFEVDCIVDVRTRTEYLIKWKGYGVGESSWQPEENLNCAQALRQFWKRQKTMSQVDGKRKKKGSRAKTGAQPSRRRSKRLAK